MLEISWATAKQCENFVLAKKKKKIIIVVTQQVTSFENLSEQTNFVLQLSLLTEKVVDR